MTGKRFRLSFLGEMTLSVTIDIISKEEIASKRVFGAKKKMMNLSRLLRSMVPSIGIR